MPKGFSGTGELRPITGIQYNIWEGRYYGGDNYFHHKTNISFSSWSMHRIEAVGYSYGANAAIRSVLCFHVSYGNGFYQIDKRNWYAGMEAVDLYVSSDNYVVCIFFTPSYYSGWSINAYTLNPTGTYNVQILAVAQRPNNAPYF